MEGVELPPHMKKPRQCVSFVPMKEADDPRTGRKLWPEEGQIGKAQRFLVAELASGTQFSKANFDLLFGQRIAAQTHPRELGPAYVLPKVEKCPPIARG